MSVIAMEHNSAASLAGEADRSRHYNDAIVSIQEMASLAPDWDLYGGTAPSEPCISFAVNLLFYAKHFSSLPVPQVAPISDGVFVDWTLGDTRLYFEIDGESVLFVHSGELDFDGECGLNDVDAAILLIDQLASDTCNT